MTVSYPLLGILDQRPNYGYELKKRYDSLFGRGRPLAIGYLYSTLSRLERDQKITEQQATEPSGGPGRKRYAITPFGREDLKTWLFQPEVLEPKMQTILFAKVVTAILVDEDPNIYLDAQRVSHLMRMHELTEIRNEGDLSQALRADYDLFRLEADLRWMDITAARLETLAKELCNE